MKDFKANETEAIMLHSRKYRETSLICELFTKKIGRVSVIAKGARSKKNKFQNITSPNVLANINFSGRSELRTLTAWEELSYFQILGKNLRVLLYLNELISKTSNAFCNINSRIVTIQNTFRKLSVITCLISCVSNSS